MSDTGSLTKSPLRLQTCDPDTTGISSVSDGISNEFFQTTFGELNMKFGKCVLAFVIILKLILHSYPCIGPFCSYMPLGLK